MTSTGSATDVDLGDRVAAIETALEGHWSLFGGYPGARLRDEGGILWFESPIRHLPYNGVIRTRIEPGGEDAVIGRIVASFRERGVPFMWVERPSDRPADLGRRLAAQGLDLVETATGMDLDLDRWRPGPPHHVADIRHVDAPGADPRGLQDYEELIRTYWSVPEHERHMIEALNRFWTGDRNPGTRLVAYLEGHPVGKCYVNLMQAPAWAAVYGVAVRPEARGRGIASALMEAAIAHAVASDARRVVLHSSTMALSMYQRLGFEARCMLPVHATEALFGTHHH